MNGIHWGFAKDALRYDGPAGFLEELADQGYALVPARPTMDMVAEGLKVGSVVEIYQAMVNSAPGVAE